MKEFDGLEGCRKALADDEPVGLKVEAIRLNRDRARATVLFEDGARRTYQLVREGKPSDPYDGWKLNGPGVEPGGTTEELPDEEGSDAAEKPAPNTPEERAKAYEECLQSAGAEEIESRRADSAAFRAGEALLFTQFWPSTAAAKDTLRKAKEQASFAIQEGKQVLFSISEPSPDGVSLAKDCLKKIGA